MNLKRFRIDFYVRLLEVKFKAIAITQFGKPYTIEKNLTFLRLPYIRFQPIYYLFLLWLTNSS
jgi:hypothetical protein